MGRSTRARAGVSSSAPSAIVRTDHAADTTPAAARSSAAGSTVSVRQCPPPDDEGEHHHQDQEGVGGRRRLPLPDRGAGRGTDGERLEEQAWAQGGQPGHESRRHEQGEQSTPRHLGAATVQDEGDEHDPPDSHPHGPRPVAHRPQPGERHQRPSWAQVRERSRPQEHGHRGQDEAEQLRSLAPAGGARHEDTQSDEHGHEGAGPPPCRGGDDPGEDDDPDRPHRVDARDAPRLVHETPGDLGEPLRGQVRPVGQDHQRVGQRAEADAGPELGAQPEMQPQVDIGSGPQPDQLGHDGGSGDPRDPHIGCARTRSTPPSGRNRVRPGHRVVSVGPVGVSSMAREAARHPSRVVVRTVDGATPFGPRR